MATMTRRTGNVVAGILALVLTAFLVVRTSSAVFTATTDNTGNSVQAGTLVLTDDDAGGVLLTMTNVAPGDTQEACIDVTYNGSLDPLPVRVYSTSAFVTDSTGHPNNDPGIPDTNPDDGVGTAMETVVNIRIEEGSFGVAGDCGTFVGSGTVSGGLSGDASPTTLGAWHTATAAGFTAGDVGAFDPAVDGDSQTYRVTLELDPSTNNAYQGVGLTGISITWETQSA